MNETKPQFLYYLLDPRNNQVRYVGISTRPRERLRGHVRHSDGHTHRAHWIRELAAASLAPILSIRCIVETREEVCRLEIECIKRFRARGVCLVNTTTGGDGGGGIRSAEHLQKLLTSNLGNTKAVGYKHSEESKRKMREKRKGRTPALGKKWKWRRND